MTKLVYEERLAKEEDPEFVVYFLNDDDELSVNVDEVRKVNLAKILRHIQLGGSVFIASKRSHKNRINPY